MIDKDALLRPRLLEEELELLSGGTVLVRGLSRAEVRHLRSLPDEQFEPALLATGVVKPELTPEEAAAWSAAAPAAEIEEVYHKISDLSGMGVHSPKEAYKSIREQPDA